MTSTFLSFLQVGKPLLLAVRAALKLPAGSNVTDSELVESLGLNAFSNSGSQARRTTFEDVADDVAEEAGMKVSVPSTGSVAVPVSGDDIGGDFDFQVNPICAYICILGLYIAAQYVYCCIMHPRLNRPILPF